MSADATKDRLDLLYEAARKIVFSGPRVYVGDPDHMSEDAIRATMKYQDEQAVLDEFRRLISGTGGGYGA